MADTQEQAVAEAWAAVPPNSDGSRDMKRLLDEVEARLPFDPKAALRAKAKAAVDRQTKPGTTEPDGQLHIPGLDPYDYEPDRLIPDDDGHLYRQDDALPHVKQAQMTRSRKNRQRVVACDDRQAQETDLYMAWVIDELSSGRPRTETTFGNFRKETGLWEATPAIDVDTDGLLDTLSDLGDSLDDMATGDDDRGE